MDIREFNALPNDKIPDELFNLDILDGSPPCTTFSMSGKREKSWGKKKKFREGQAEQTLDDLLFIFVDTVAKLRPKTVVMENVEGLIKGNAVQYVNKVYSKFEHIGYGVRAYLLKGEDMGIPQRRHRVFFIASRDNNFDFDSLDMNFNYEPIIFKTVKGNDVPKECSSTVKELLNQAEPNVDHCLADVYKHLGERPRRFNETIVWDDEVAPTVHAHGQYRGVDKTCLSSLDYLHIQTFPEDYQCDSTHQLEYLVGMSVPPVMIKRIVDRMIKANMFKED